MKSLSMRILVVIALIMLVLPAGTAAKKKKDKKDVYRFTMEKELPSTPVKSQGRTGTCWIFSTVSFLESEVMRKGGPAVDLSEMVIARRAYTDKAGQYVYMHGQANFGPGGQSHDVIDQMRGWGIVPESVYPGKISGQKEHNHGELGSVLKSFLDAVIRRRGGRLTPVWDEAFEALLDVYMGRLPDSFTWKDREFTPLTFMKDYLKINPDDYIELTSYSHHPFYQQCRLEVPDNWSYNDDYYNIPLDDLLAVALNAIERGYTFAWDADVSERFFSKDRMDVSLIPRKDWEDLTREERDAPLKDRVKEKDITQEMRQKTFLNWTTTDDHLMHIIGTARDQKGARYFYMKNSWGTDRKYKGYFYVSLPYFKLKTICLMVHKDALGEDLKRKLGLE